MLIFWEASEYPLHYDWGKDADASDLNKAILYSLIFKILNAIAPCEKYAKGIASVENVDAVIERARVQFEDTLKEWGRKYKREELIYTMGSGACYGEAYSFAICLLIKYFYNEEIRISLTEGKKVSDLEIVMVLKNYKKQQMNDAGGN